MKFRLLFSIILSALFPSILHAEEPIKIGVPTALTGDAAPFGIDIKNALSLFNEKYGQGKYELIFEDEQCTNKVAVSVAQKLIDIDKVNFALGFPCNQSFLATAPLYERAGVVTITSSATSGDVLEVGQNLFRLFPSDTGAAELLYTYIAKHHKKILILTEQTEYPVMMERTFVNSNKRSASPLEIASIQFVHGETDLRTMLLAGLAKGADAVFVNVNSDTSFVPVVQQLKALKYSGARYAAYVPASSTVQKTLGADLNGFIFSNLPTTGALMSKEGRELMDEFKKRYGEPQSGFPVVPTSFEAFNTLDMAIKSGVNPVEYLRSNRFKGKFIHDFYFDEHGAVQGIRFEMQKIEEGRVFELPK